MYNLNVNLAQSAANAVNSLLSVDGACSTPRTPEILNSLIAMTNPLDGYAFGGGTGGDEASERTGATPTSASQDSNSSGCSRLESPCGTGGGSGGAPPSIRHTCSQLIKAGLKLSIEQKRKCNSESEDLLDLDRCKRIKKSESESEDKIKSEGLTVEDEERRRRRRERNKIAATKCRLKKREKTINLIQESQTLDDQNIDLKKQVQELQGERRQLLELLASHRPHCKNDVPHPSREVVVAGPPTATLFLSTGPSSVEPNHSYATRPPSTDQTYKSSPTIAASNVYERQNGASGISRNAPFGRTLVQYTKLPDIVVDAPTDAYRQQLTNLEDSKCVSYHYSNQQCHAYGGSNQNYGNNGMDSGCMA